jgi:hypothetical protein
MRDYFQPRLLPRLLAGDKLPGVRPLKDLNRVQPTVEIEDFSLTDSQLGRGELTIRVAQASETLVRNDIPPVTTDAYDVRLFRDGRLVGWAPKGSVEWQQMRPAEGSGKFSDLSQWRTLTQITSGPNASARLTFPVQIPRAGDATNVTFTAYAFNEDRVKSATATATFPIPTDIIKRQGIAYIISIGVNRTDSSPLWDLRYAVDDARALGVAVEKRLRASRQFADVVSLQLVSDHAPARKGEVPATTAHLKTVLDLLAGRSVSPDRLAAIPDTARLQRAEPEDLVLISVSSHGYTDERGVFHFVLADTGAKQPQEVTSTLAGDTLSSDELSIWLREIDAGELVLIVDACHSEATVNADGFKPGPMGSRGLGQLAYDKGMRILAASRTDESAYERGGAVNQGLLTYTLVREGLEDRKADFQPHDGVIGLSEWLAYAVEAVPVLFADTGSWTSSTITRVSDATRRGFIVRKSTPLSDQRPVLFDFGPKRGAEVRLLAPSTR